MPYEFKFPDVGEGITEGEIVSWSVKEGDTVQQDQTLAEVETDKAVVELPSPVAGVVKQLHGEAGDMINVGDVLVTLDQAQPEARPETKPAPGAQAPQEAPPQDTERVVAPPAGRPEGAAPTTARPAAEEEVYTGSVVGRLEEAPEEEAAPHAEQPAIHEAPAASSRAAAQPEILALPSVRALAKELGVDLSLVRGTGPGGRIMMQDVEDIAQEVAYGGQAPKAAAPEPVAPEQAATQPAEAPPAAAAEAVGAKLAGPAVAAPEERLDTDAFGPIERIPFRGVRRTMAKRMAESASRQAQVTTMDEADVTVLRHIREKEKEAAAERGVHLTYLAFAVKACTSALKRFPRLNATLDSSGDEYVLKHYYNMGIAIDTEHGLMVPNIKNAGEKSIYEIAAELLELVHRAQERTLDVPDLHGGTFTITNYGAIGSTYATPIVNYPEVAILGMGRVGEVPVVRNGQVVPRLMLPLSLTFDHQLVDGAEAARFLNAVVGYLEDPDLLLLEGA